MICIACPRRCGVDREKETGVCGVPETFVIARAAKHFWEEPCISGKNGSGTVFFSGCSLRCVFCQNAEISRGCFGKDVTDDALMRIFDRLIESGAHNLNLVTPTHYAPRLARVLKQYRAPVPVIWNSGGYESEETLKLLEGLVDVYLPDLKYIQSDRSLRYSGAADYFECAKKALLEMRRQQPADVFSDGLIQKGMMVRHLILPKNTNQSIAILRWLRETFGPTLRVSLMAQYTPCGALERFPELQRPITAREYDKVVDALLELGFQDAFVQERAAADTAFIPAFDLTGVEPDQNM